MVYLRSLLNHKMTGGRSPSPPPCFFFFFLFRLVLLFWLGCSWSTFWLVTPSTVDDGSSWNTWLYRVFNCVFLASSSSRRDITVATASWTVVKSAEQDERAILKYSSGDNSRDISRLAKLAWVESSIWFMAKEISTGASRLPVTETTVHYTDFDISFAPVSREVLHKTRMAQDQVLCKMLDNCATFMKSISKMIAIKVTGSYCVQLWIFYTG